MQKIKYSLLLRNDLTMLRHPTSNVWEQKITTTMFSVLY